MSAVADPLVGRVLDQRYQVRRRIARGGMATVYEAVDLRLDRGVAVKVMHSALAADDEFVDRFRREARSAARLAGPHVVAVTDQGREGDTVFLVMELVEGRTLRDVLRERGRLSAHQALEVLEPVLSALSAAHRAGLVHRDVKPENVLLGDDGSIKVADFGLARAVDESPLNATAGVLLGTVAYVAPEQVSRQGTDARSDVYAAGIVLFELVTGRPPFDGGSALSIAYQHLHETVPAPSTVRSSVPPVIDDLVLRATATDPDLRPMDAGAMLAMVRLARRRLPPPGSPGSGDDELGGEADDRFATSVIPTLPSPTPPRRSPPAARWTGAAAIGAAAMAADGAARAGTGTLTRGAVRRGPVDNAAHAGAAGRTAPEDDDLEGDDLGHHDTGGVGQIDPGDTGDTGDLREDDADEARPRRRLRLRRPRGGLVRLVLLLLLLAGGALGGWWVAVGSRAQVPAVSGLAPTAATDLLSRSHLTARVADPGAYSETVPRGDVATTDPSGGSRVGRGGTVLLHLSLGPERYGVPGLARLSLAQATTALRIAHLTVGNVTRRYDDRAANGDVLSSTPAATVLARPGQAVALVVSGGPAPVTAPDVSGQPADQARAALEKVGLVVHPATANSDTVPQGDVIGISPTDGLHRRQAVAMKVSLGPQLVTVPNVLGDSASQARQALEGFGFQVRVLRPLFADGTVVAVRPGVGSLVPHTATITIVVV